MPERKFRPEIKPEADVEITRAATQITLARVSNYRELWAETEQEGDEKFIQKTRELWKEFAVHGIWGVDKETGERIILNFTDLDGRCALGFLKEAGIDTRDVKYIAPGESIRGRVNLDTGDRHGVVVEDEGKTAFFDHHGSESGDITSATEITYKVLASLGLLEREAYLDKLVEFVNCVDNANYVRENRYKDYLKNYFDNSWRTALGLQRFAQFTKLVEFFKEGRDPTEPLSSRDLRKYGFVYLRGKGEKRWKVDRSAEQREVVQYSQRALKVMEWEGLIIDSDRYGKIAIDVGKTVPEGSKAAAAYGCGAYVIWNPETESFFISTVQPLADEFGQGKKVRETMWIKPRDDEAPLSVTLGEILDQMTDGKLRPKSRLKEILGKEKSSNTSKSLE